MPGRILKFILSTALIAILAAGCTTTTDMGTQRMQLLASLEREMHINTSWVRVHAADSLTAHGQMQPVAELFHSEEPTATPPYRIGVWRVLARSAKTDAERKEYVARIRNVMYDPQAIDRVSATESLGKLRAESPSDNKMLERWLLTADDATAAFPRWLLVLSTSGSERAENEMKLAALLDSDSDVARLRAGYALGRLKDISPESLKRLRKRFDTEPSDSIARLYITAALYLHTSHHPELVPALEKQLFAYLERGTPNEQLEAGTAIGLHGNKEHLGILLNHLSAPNADGRIGAANGALYLLQ